MAQCLVYGALLLCLPAPVVGDLHLHGPRSAALAHPAPLALTDPAAMETTLDAVTQIADAEATQKAIREAMEALEKHIESARQAQKLELVSCLVDHQARLRALLRVVTTATVLLQEALDRGDPKEASREHRRVIVAREHFKRLMLEAAACADTEAAPVSPTGEAVTRVVERPLTGEGAIVDPIDTVLDPDLGTLPCW